VREASLSSSSLCHSAWHCFKLEEEWRKDEREQMKGEGKEQGEGGKRERKRRNEYYNQLLGIHEQFNKG